MIFHSYVCEDYFVGASISESSPLLIGDLVSIDGLFYKVTSIKDVRDSNYLVGKLVTLAYIEDGTTLTLENIKFIDTLKEVKDELST